MGLCPCALLLTLGQPTFQTYLERAVAKNRCAVHHPSMGHVVPARVVLCESVVPECEVVDLPPPPKNQSNRM